MYKKGRVNSNSRIISTDEDPSLRIESSAIINLRGVSTKLNKYIVLTMQTYKKLMNEMVLGFIPIVRSIKRRKNARPGLTTEHAKFRRPLSDCISLSVR